jgi:hypothetical protein
MVMIWRHRFIINYLLHTLTLTPFACFWIDIVGIETTWFVHALNHTSDVVHFGTVHWVTCHIWQVCKLKMEGSHLWQNAAATTCPAIILAWLPNDHTDYLQEYWLITCYIYTGWVKLEYVVDYALIYVWTVLAK